MYTNEVSTLVKELLEEAIQDAIKQTNSHSSSIGEPLSNEDTLPYVTKNNRTITPPNVGWGVPLYQKQKQKPPTSLSRPVEPVDTNSDNLPDLLKERRYKR